MMKHQIHWKTHFIELLAVIIGITIAFNLEQWGENKKKEAFEIATLKNLKDEIQFDIESIDSVLADNLRDIKLGQKVILWKWSKTKVPNDSVLKTLPSIFRMEGFTLTLDSYQTLRQSGDINIIQSPLIKKQLSKLIIRDYQDTYRQYLACEKAIVDYVLYSDYFNQNYDFIASKFKKKYIIDDLEFTNRVTLIMNLKAAYVHMLKSHKKIYEELKEEVEKYLSKNS